MTWSLRLRNTPLTTCLRMSGCWATRSADRANCSRARIWRKRNGAPPIPSWPTYPRSIITIRERGARKKRISLSAATGPGSTRKIHRRNKRNHIQIGILKLWLGAWLRLMERETGIEPATSSLGSWRSTAELLPLRLANNALNDVSLPPLPVPHNRITSQGVFSTSHLAVRHRQGIRIFCSVEQEFAARNFWRPLNEVFHGKLFH